MLMKSYWTQMIHSNRIQLPTEVVIDIRGTIESTAVLTEMVHFKPEEKKLEEASGSIAEV